MADAGLDVEWRIIRGQDEFFDVTKTIHNALQGDPRGLTRGAEEIFRRYNAINADEVDGRVRLRRRPRPAAGGDRRPLRGRLAAKWIWRGHIDFSTPNPQVLDFLLPSIRALRRRHLPPARVRPARRTRCRPCVIWPPAIDPLAPKNMALSPEDAAYIVDQFGIDVERPLLTQVSRFDPWKDPLGVIDAYRIVKERSPATSSSRWSARWRTTTRRAGTTTTAPLEHADGDPDIFILSNLNNVGAVEVNAFQVHSAAVVQKSIREGFGLTVSEALWKARPMVAGRVGGIVVQIEDGETGWLVDSAEQCAAGVPRDPRDPTDGARQRALRRQGARAPPLPHAAPAARLARALQPPARPRHRPSRRARDRRGVRHGLTPTYASACWRRRRRLIVVSNRGPVGYVRDAAGAARRAPRRRRARDGAAQPRLAPRRDVDRERDRARRIAPSRPRPAAARSRRRARDGSPLPAAARRARPRPRTTGTTTSSRTRCSGSSSTTSGRCPPRRTSTRACTTRGTRATSRSTAPSPTRCSTSSTQRPDATVFFHDYHLYLAPALRPRRAPRRALAHFIHIPWPQSDYWRVLHEPMRGRDPRRPARERRRRLPHRALEAATSCARAGDIAALGRLRLGRAR